MLKRFITLFVTFSFILSYYQPIYAQDFSINQLPVPGTMVGESVPFTPLALKGLVINLQKPLEFQFIVDTGKGPQDTASVKDQANQLVKYFLTGLTLPEGDLWVNLSPYEKNRMVPEALGQTDLGRDLLAQDYILKQLTASLIYPEKDLGKEFWSKVYARAQAQFGTTNVPVNTFNKVWILPDQAQVFEHGAAAYVTKATLKIMLDEDYTALQKHMPVRNGTDSIGSQIVRQIILPEIEKEVNTGKNFAPLRQIYQALILAKWYKETIQNGLLDAVYTNKNKVAGVNLADPAVKEQIYNRYLQAYKKGAFNYIKEDPTPEGQIVPRKYFSGGAYFAGKYKIDKQGSAAMISVDGAMLIANVSLKQNIDPAMFAGGFLDSPIQPDPIIAKDFSDIPGLYDWLMEQRDYFDPNGYLKKNPRKLIRALPKEFESHAVDIADILNGKIKSGKGTPNGDGKDIRMREVANGGAIVELYNDGVVPELEFSRVDPVNGRNNLDSLLNSGIFVKDRRGHISVVAQPGEYIPRPTLLRGRIYNGIWDIIKPSSSRTTQFLGAPRGVPGEVIMLARNGSLKGEPLMPRTQQAILQAYRNGASFVVGDMPNVDTQFMEYLMTIGAPFTVYHTGDKSRVDVFGSSNFLESRIKALPDRSIGLFVGGTSSLKSTRVADFTGSNLGAEYNVIVVPMDNYMKDEKFIQSLDKVKGVNDIDNPEAYDLEEVARIVRDIKSGNIIQIRQGNGTFLPVQFLPDKHNVLIVDGIYSTHPDFLKKLQDVREDIKLAVLFQAPWQLRAMRRLRRDRIERGLPPEKMPKRLAYLRNAIDSEKKYIFDPLKEQDLDLVMVLSGSRQEVLDLAAQTQALRVQLAGEINAPAYDAYKEGLSELLERIQQFIDSAQTSQIPVEKDMAQASDNPVLDHIKSITIQNRDSVERSVAQVDFQNIVVHSNDSEYIGKLVQSVINYVAETWRSKKRLFSVELYVTNNSVGQRLNMTFKDEDGHIISLANITALSFVNNENRIVEMALHQGPLGGVFYTGIGAYQAGGDGRNLVLITNKKGRQSLNPEEKAEIETASIRDENRLLYAGASPLSKAIADKIQASGRSPATLFNFSSQTQGVWTTEKLSLGTEKLGGDLLEKINIISGADIVHRQATQGIPEGKANPKVGVIMIGAGRYANKAHFPALVELKNKVSLIGVVAKTDPDRVMAERSQYLQQLGVDKSRILINADSASDEKNWLNDPHIAEQVETKALKFLKFKNNEFSENFKAGIYSAVGKNFTNVEELNEYLSKRDLYDQYANHDSVRDDAPIAAQYNICREKPSKLNWFRLSQLVLERVLGEIAPKSRRVAFIVTTRSKFHKQYTEWALERGYHVLVDKPLTIPGPEWTLESPDAMAILNDAKALMERSAQDPTVLFMMATQKRYNDVVRNICSHVSTAGGPIKHISFVYNNGIWSNPSQYGIPHAFGANRLDGDGGKVAHSGYHFIDLLPWILQSAGDLQRIDHVEVYSTVQRPHDIIAYNNLVDHEQWGQYNGPRYAPDRSVSPQLQEINANIEFNFKDVDNNTVTTATLSMFHGGPFSSKGKVKTEEIIVSQNEQTIRYSRIAKFDVSPVVQGDDVGTDDHEEIVVQNKGVLQSSGRFDVEDDTAPAREYLETLYSMDDLTDINDQVRSPLWSHAIGIKLMAAIYLSVFARQDNGPSRVVTVEISNKEKEGLRRAYSKTDGAMHSGPGGIDLNSINLQHNGHGVNVEFDPDQLDALIRSRFDGFAPVVTGLQHISNPFQLLGINNPAKEPEVLAKA